MELDASSTLYVGSLRGREDPLIWLKGIGGIPFTELETLDLIPRGKTYLWEPLGELLIKVAANIGAFPSARILLMDLSGSMSAHRDMLKRMWASIPESGMVVSGLEIMIITDGKDNQSPGLWKGNTGVVTLLVHASKLGFDCGYPYEPTIGKLHVTVLDVSGKTLNFPEARGTTIITTRNPMLISSVIQTPRPDITGRINEETALSIWPQLGESIVKEIEKRENALDACVPISRYDLNALIRNIVAKKDSNEQKWATSAMLHCLYKLIHNAETFKVQRLGPNRDTFHSEINSMLYTLRSENIVVKDSAHKWTAGPKAYLISNQIKFTDVAAEMLFNSDNLEDVITKVLDQNPSLGPKLITTIEQAAKRIKKSL